MNGPSGVLCPKIMMRKNSAKQAIIGIIHHILWVQRKPKRLIRIENLDFSEARIRIGYI